jgi:hypothetical protein
VASASRAPVIARVAEEVRDSPASLYGRSATGESPNPRKSQRTSRYPASTSTGLRGAHMRRLHTDECSTKAGRSLTRRERAIRRTAVGTAPRGTPVIGIDSRGPSVPGADRSSGPLLRPWPGVNGRCQPVP